MSGTEKRSAARVRANTVPVRIAGMSAKQRRHAAPDFNRAERTVWAARYPNEVPLVNGELPWIALNAE